MRREGAPRPEPQAPDGIETRAQLARGLTALRIRSGLTVREIARRLDTPSATVGDYFSGRHLPGPAQLPLFRALLRECGLGEDELDGWAEALARVRLSSDGRVGRPAPPYRGLEPFQLEDAALFFGREAATAELLDRLRRMCEEPPRAEAIAALLLLVGPSGSGKSSLLRAGVAAAVQAGALGPPAEHWSATVLTPGEASLAELDACLDGTAGRRVVVDQLEELFALSGEQRRAFLVGLGRLRPPRTLVVASMRSDFYEAAVREPLLLPALRERQVLVGPMSAEQVRRAIVEPARRVGALVDDSLVELLLADLAPGSPSGFAHEAGALPLLSHALLATWARAPRSQLTVADYRSAGGLHGAVAQSAEQLYGQLSDEERALARRIFRRLVRVDGDAPLTRRRVARQELEGAGDSRADMHRGAGVEEVLGRFVEARLITLDGTAVKLSHEALLSAWPRLAGWLDEDQASLRLHHELADAAAAWVASERDESLLPRGARLGAIAGWAEQRGHRSELNRVERDYLEAALALAEAERRAARRRTRRMQQLLAAVGALAFAAAALAALALHAQHAADRARDEALSRQVAIEADGLARTDPSLAMQLALAAYRISPTTQATSTLIDASAAEMPTRLLGAPGPTSMAVSGNDAELAVGYSATDRVKLFSLSGSTPRPIAAVSTGPPSTQVFAVALSPDGRLLAAGGTGRQVIVWSLVNPRRPMKLATLEGFASTVYDLSFSPDGRLLAAADNDGTVRQWSLASPSHPVARPVLAAPGRSSLQAVSYSPDERTLAAAGANGRLIVWRLDGGSQPLARATVGATTLTSLAYSPDGKRLAAGGQDAHVYLWRLGDEGAPQARARTLGGFGSWVDSVAFSHSGAYLAAGDSDNSLRIWSTSSWSHVATLYHPAPVTGVAFTAHDRHLVTVDEDGTARIWSFPPPASLHVPGSVFTIDYTSDGKELAVASGGPSGEVSLWNVADAWHPTPISSISVGGSFGPIAGVATLSRDGGLLAVGDERANVQLLALSKTGRRHAIGPLLRGAVAPIEQLVFSPNAHVLAVGDAAGIVHMWDVANPADPSALATIDPSGGGGSDFGLVFSPSGKLLATATEDGEVRLWDVSDPRDPRALDVLHAFKGYAYTVAFTPNGRTLIAAGADDAVRLWNLSDPSRPRPLGRRLTGPTSTIYDVSVSPDGSTLAASTTAGEVWLWDIRDPARPIELADLTAADGPVFDVTFSPDGSTLVASGADETLHLWHYRPAQVAARICASAGDTITRAEWAQYIEGEPYRPPCR